MCLIREKRKKRKKQKRTKTRPPCHTDHSRHNPRDFNFGKALMCPFTLTLRSRITKSQHCSITVYYQTNQHWALTITYWEACATRTTCPSLSIPNPSLSFHTPRADIPAKFKNNIHHKERCKFIKQIEQTFLMKLNGRITIFQLGVLIQPQGFHFKI